MTLEEGIEAQGLSLPNGAIEKLLAYLALLAKWNKVYNLTAIRDPAQMVTHHILDSLSILRAIEMSAPAGRRFSLADIGSGAGLPGLVLAVARPGWSLTSVETVEKKAAFQRQAAIELGLSNVSIHCGRVEELAGSFDGVVSRAFASLADFASLAGHLCADGGFLWAMKGAYPAAEVEALPPDWRVVAHHELKVPGLDAERCLLQLGRK